MPRPAWALRSDTVLGARTLGGALAAEQPPPAREAAPAAPLQRELTVAADETRRALAVEHLLEVWQGEEAAPPSLPDGQLRLAQRLLTALGYYSGPIDGLPGPASRAAVTAFQAIRGLPETGEVTPALLSAMRATF